MNERHDLIFLNDAMAFGIGISICILAYARADFVMEEGKEWGIGVYITTWQRAAWSWKSVEYQISDLTPYIMADKYA